MSGQTSYTPQQAADLVGCHRTKISRWCKDGRLPNAHLTEDGQWRVPLQGLITAGLYDPAAQPEAPAETIRLHRVDSELADILEEVRTLRAALATAQAELYLITDERKRLWRTVEMLAQTSRTA